MRWLACTAALAAVAGCSDSNGPGGPSFDARRVKEGVATIERVSDAPVLQSFRALGGTVETGGVTAGPADRLIGAIRGVAALALGPASGVQLVPVIRNGILGKTLVFDPAGNKY